MTTTLNTPASAVNEAAHVIADHSRRAPNAPLSEEWIRLTIRYAIQEAIARDRAERDAELVVLRTSDQKNQEICLDVMRERDIAQAKLAEQSAALDACKAVLGKWEEVHDDMFAFFCSNGMFNRWGKDYNCTKFNEAVLDGTAALAQIEALAGKGQS